MKGTFLLYHAEWGHFAMIMQKGSTSLSSCPGEHCISLLLGEVMMLCSCQGEHFSDRAKGKLFTTLMPRRATHFASVKRALYFIWPKGNTWLCSCLGELFAVHATKECLANRTLCQERTLSHRHMWQSVSNLNYRGCKPLWIVKEGQLRLR